MSFFTKLFDSDSRKQKTTSTKEAKCKVVFDSNGQVVNIEIPQGNWAVKQKGQNKYYMQNANNLLEASEILKKIGYIPQLNYYVVDTQNGSLCRDINGYYTEASIKTKNLIFESRCEKSETVNFSSLTGFGDMQANQMTVAHLKKTGQYSKLVLLMKCGNCGYQSPIETQPGTLIRECYCCGVENKGHRGTITMFIGSSKVEI